MPSPQDVVRRRPPSPRESDFTSTLRSPAVASRIGSWLGVTFMLAFVTGLISHFAQAQTMWFPFPAAPSWGYRVTQGVHVISGTAAVPLLLVKLWTVFPKLFAGLPRKPRAMLGNGLERVSIGVLVAAAIFQLASGLANSAQWYPWSFSFRATHYAVGWIAIGALLVHIAVKLPIIRRAWANDVDSTELDRPGTTAAAPDQPGGLTRRGLLRTTWLATGAAVLATAGSTIPALRHLSLLGVRSGEGPQGVPINKTAQAAGVTESAVDPAYVLLVSYAGRKRRIDIDGLRAMAQRTASLPIACVEGWSASASWTGVQVRALLDLVGAPGDSDVVVHSLQRSGPFRSTLLPGHFADHPDTLLALELNGETLNLDHGHPCRLMAPNRPGVLQTKWVHHLEVMA